MLTGRLILVPHMESQVLIRLKVPLFDMLFQICRIVLKPKGCASSQFFGGFVTHPNPRIFGTYQAWSHPPLMSALRWR